MLTSGEAADDWHHVPVQRKISVQAPQVTPLHQVSLLVTLKQCLTCLVQKVILIPDKRKGKSRVFLRLYNAVPERHLGRRHSLKLCYCGARHAWFSVLYGVLYSATRYTKSSFVFQLNDELRSALSENARYACHPRPRERNRSEGPTQNKMHLVVTPAFCILQRM